MAEQRDDDQPVTPSESQSSSHIPPLGQASPNLQPSSDWPQSVNGANGTNSANGVNDVVGANGYAASPAQAQTPAAAAFLQQAQQQAAMQQPSAQAYQAQGYQQVSPYAVMPSQPQTVTQPYQYAAAQVPASYVQQQPQQLQQPQSPQQYAAMPQAMAGQPVAPQQTVPPQPVAAQQPQGMYLQQPQAGMPRTGMPQAVMPQPQSMPPTMPEDGGEVMLLGTYTPKIDTKGRMALPAKFRTQLGPGLIMARGQERCVYLFPQAEFRRVAMQIQHTSLGNKAAREYLRVLLSGAVDQTPDKQGRVLVPQMLRDYAKLGSDIVVIGVGTRAEIWDKQAWEQYLADNEQGYSDIADDVLPTVEW